MVGILDSVGGSEINNVLLPVMVSEAMRVVVSSAADVAETDASVLLLGESGTGKEVVARFIHEMSRRKSRPCVSLNCGVLPEELLEGELLGPVAAGTAGVLERAAGGTLILDEVAEMSLALQTKLLRVLQDSRLQLRGGVSVPLDVRIIATSHRDLRAEVVAGRFRADLYYRLCVFPIVIPPLRERRPDIEALARYFVERVSRDLGRTVPVLSATALATLDSYEYGGNVRELRNLIERALIRCRLPVIDSKDLFFDPPLARSPAQIGELGAPRLVAVEGGWSLPVDLGELERLAIGEALRRVSGNRTHAARLLGISLRTLRNKLKAWRENGVILDVAAEGQPTLPARHERDGIVARSSQEKTEEQAA